VKKFAGLQTVDYFLHSVLLHFCWLEPFWLLMIVYDDNTALSLDVVGFTAESSVVHLQV